MADIQALRGIRYNLARVGSLSHVVAPPYDVIDGELQDRLYDEHPANVVRLILNRPEPADDTSRNRYTRAAGFLRRWLAEGLLVVEPDPAVYVYHQHFRWGHQERTRRGFLCRVGLERFGTGRIYPHEDTYPGPKVDRLELMRACRANLSPVFGMYPDEENLAQQLLDYAVAAKPPLEATDYLGVVHRMWPVSDPVLLTELARIMGPKPIFVADGHHRYETACDYRDQLQREQGRLPAQHPANFVLMTCVSMHDPGLVVLPTHRVLRDPPAIDSKSLRERLGGSFAVTPAGEGLDQGPLVWNEIETEGRAGTLGFYCPADGRWLVARLTADGRARMEQVAPDHGTGWRALSVSILHRLVVETLLGIHNGERPEYVHRVEELIGLFAGGGPQSKSWSLGALVMPATLDEIRRISESGERMPQKSTYFYPKLLSGLVINPLE
jgi:uncharacterized protein (DUF1015 family)